MYSYIAKIYGDYSNYQGTKYFKTSTTIQHFCKCLVNVLEEKKYKILTIERNGRWVAFKGEFVKDENNGISAAPAFEFGLPKS